MPKLGEDLGERPVCPKPRRIGSVVPEFIDRPECSHYKGGGSSEVIDMISTNVRATDNIYNLVGDGQEPTSIRCFPSYYCGSPPTRTNNPLVHDVQFIHQVELFAPAFRRTDQLSADRLGLGSPSPA